MNQKTFFRLLPFSSLLIFLILFFFNSCGDYCDDESYYEYSALSFKIIDPATGNNFFNTTDTNYQISNFRIIEIDAEGQEHTYDLDFLPLFPNYDNTRQELVQSIKQPFTKYYYFRFNATDEDTLKILFKGTFTSPCNYDIMEYYKVYYNEKLVYYDLYPHNLYPEDNEISIYKSI